MLKLEIQEHQEINKDQKSEHETEISDLEKERDELKIKLEEELKS